jgi:hypothetical protein
VIRAVIRVAAIALGTVALLVVAFVGYVQLAWNRPVGRTVVALNGSRDAEHVRRGQYLYEKSLLCWDCHGAQGSHSSSEPSSTTA